MLTAAAPRLVSAAASVGRMQMTPAARRVAPVQISRRTFLFGPRNTDGTPIDRRPWVFGTFFSTMLYLNMPTIKTDKTSKMVPPEKEIGYMRG
mmetsp:Transcript_14573/g.19034  ORF Transcript_14573/g.19034 Transcript_14573/m.19034 type:complete len:93 (-) Transcript_14573:405-683(-)|eukprot:CAMPEP_0198141914 /NCGR_PEP_ID=MMETSP1443-20131203/4837_1 /TAXON_ID=186043 /ORGANISM="Entomoneis sp., Strain CCMP2396" /LENGTH=92 /DNA_ID=CAMNT_0043804801 /DNA_START=112 /DNA_END=390 /DNA_ORIENTATION=-